MKKFVMLSNLLFRYKFFVMLNFFMIKLLSCWQGATVILSGPSGPPVTTVPSQNSELVGDCMLVFCTVIDCDKDSSKCSEGMKPPY